MKARSHTLALYCGIGSSCIARTRNGVSGLCTLCNVQQVKSMPPFSKIIACFPQVQVADAAGTEVERRWNEPYRKFKIWNKVRLCK